MSEWKMCTNFYDFWITANMCERVTLQRTDPTLPFLPLGFKAHIQACPELSPQMKTMLRRLSKHRTPDEIKMAANLVRRMTVFDSYTPMVKEELGKIVYFDDFDDGRLVTAQSKKRTNISRLVSC